MHQMKQYRKHSGFGSFIKNLVLVSPETLACTSSQKNSDLRLQSFACKNVH
uniref:Uncharacterized protein n=1 Tax=Rhizophagus irregularis (strain DAOM 181602 / DAOM 197198 / MUCL 43194) TaxID=747089 RepID=U9TS78_RHIID